MGVCTIHVVDEVAQQQRDYHCDLRLLLAHMKYFKPFVELVPGQDAQLAVKCSLQTFDFLMAYVKASTTGGLPLLDCSNCNEILVASHFLKMSQLVKEAVSFVANNLLVLASLKGAEIASLDAVLLTKIAKATSEEVLEQLWEKCQQVQLVSCHKLAAPVPSSQHNKSTCSHSSSSSSNLQQVEAGGSCNVDGMKSSHLLLQKLYKLKLETLLKLHNTTIMRCLACDQLFSAASHHKLQCPAALGAATGWLKSLPLHQPDSSWTFQAFLQQQRHPPKQQTLPLQQQQQPYHQDNSKTWRELYYFTWGHVVVLYCQQCNQHFAARHHLHCSYHPKEPVFASEATAGIYPCCGRPCWSPGAPLNDSQGCTAAAHQAAIPQGSNAGEQEQSYAARAVQLIRHSGAFILQPYTPPPPPQPRVVALVLREQPTVSSMLAAMQGVATASAPAGTHNCLRESCDGDGSFPLLTRRSKAIPSSSTGTRGVSRPTSPVGCSLSDAYATSGSSRETSGTSSDDSGHSDDDLAGQLQALQYDLDYRASQLRTFMDAVRSAAQAGNRGSVLGGLGTNASRTAAKLQAEAFTPLEATFSSGGTRRIINRQRCPSFFLQSPMNSRPPSSSCRPQSSRESGRQQHQRSRAAGDLLSAAGSYHSEASTPTGVIGDDVPASQANRTLLLALMHEDDVLRMGVLMRRLDCMRLQPPPDAVSSIAADYSQHHSRYKPCLLSGQQYSVAVNGVLFEDVQSSCMRNKAAVVQGSGAVKQQHVKKPAKRLAARWI